MLLLIQGRGSGAGAHRLRLGLGIRLLFRRYPRGEPLAGNPDGRGPLELLAGNGGLDRFAQLPARRVDEEDRRPGRLAKTRDSSQQG